MTRLLIRLFVKNSEDTENPAVRKSYGTLSGGVGIFCNLILCITKIAVGLLTASISITADGLNNLSDMGSSVITLIGFKMAGKPADKDHPFGHGRMEYMSASFVSALIIVVALRLFGESVGKFKNPETPEGGALHLVPPIGVLGVGCRRGTTAERLEEAFSAFCASSGLSPAAVSAAASIDLKKDEPGLAAFCKAHGWPITFYPADELRAVPGQFTPSAFVASVTGVDNVCERSAVKASGGMLLLPKTAGGGVTLALAVRPFAPDWRTEQ